MEKHDFDLLLLRTVFACMACDQKIDDQEISHIQDRMHARMGPAFDLRGAIVDLKKELDAKGYGFFQDLFTRFSVAGLDKDMELQILRAAIDMVEANDEVEYAEIKFVKSVRSQLHLTDEDILLANAAYAEYLKPDVASNLTKQQLLDQFNLIGAEFPVLEMPEFGSLNGSN